MSILKHGVERLSDGCFSFFWAGEEVALVDFNQRLKDSQETMLGEINAFALGMDTKALCDNGKMLGKFEEIRAALAEANEEALLADGFEDALVGYVEAWLPCEGKSGKVTGSSPGVVALYDREKCVEVLVKRDGMTDEEALEYLEFNTLGAYMGPGTPAFATILRRL